MAAPGWMMCPVRRMDGPPMQAEAQRCSVAWQSFPYFAPEAKDAARDDHSPQATPHPVKTGAEDSASGRLLHDVGRR